MKIINFLEIVLGIGLIAYPQSKVSPLLGYILIFIGLSYFVWNEEISFDIDKDQQTIKWQKKRLFRKVQKNISFHEVKRIFPQRVGKASSFTEFYCISLELVSGDIINTNDRCSTEPEAKIKAQQLRDLLQTLQT